MDERKYREVVESCKKMKFRGNHLVPAEVALIHADAELQKARAECEAVCRELQDERIATAGLRADNEALRADAERYRWLRRKGGPELMYGREQYTRACLVCGNVETDLDAAIDKER